jgi:putative solute:sodium symporter small subunit
MSDNAYLTEETKKRYWVKTRGLTFVILGLWVFFSMIVPWLTGPLNDMTFLGFPLGYYMIAQGSLIAFVLLIVFQNRRQDQIDDEFGVGDE